MLRYAGIGFQLCRFRHNRTLSSDGGLWKKFQKNSFYLFSLRSLLHGLYIEYLAEHLTFFLFFTFPPEPNIDSKWWTLDEDTV